MPVRHGWTIEPYDLAMLLNYRLGSSALLDHCNTALPTSLSLGSDSLTSSEAACRSALTWASTRAPEQLRLWGWGTALRTWAAWCSCWGVRCCCVNLGQSKVESSSAMPGKSRFYLHRNVKAADFLAVTFIALPWPLFHVARHPAHVHITCIARSKWSCIQS